MSGLPASAYATGNVGITDANNLPIAGYTNLTVTPANPSVGLSGIPYGNAVVIAGTTYNTTVLHIELIFAGTYQADPAWVTTPPPTLSVTWTGPPIQALCFKTVVPPTLCAMNTAGSVAVIASAKLQDASGTTNLGPSTSSFSYQPGPACAPGGTLKVCKVAGPGVTSGTRYTFTAGSTTFTVPAGPAPGGTCVVAPTAFPVGAVVTVKERIPPGDTVVAITVASAGRIIGHPNTDTGSVDVRIGAGVTEATYTDKRTGYLEICKQADGAGVTGSYSFSVTPGGVGPIVVPVGACSPAIELPAGTVTITEAMTATTALVACYTLPAARQGTCNTATQSSTVTIAPGDTSAQTIAYIVNHHKTRGVT